jgi:excinuclease ABC subunit C
MAQQNAALQLARLLAEEGSQQARTRALAEALDLPVEELDSCASSASTSATPRARPRRPPAWCSRTTRCSSEYRRFNIDGITGGDDYAAMRQVLQRRYGKMAEALAEQGNAASVRLPDLVLVDGGKGQVSMAREVFAELAWTCR